MSAKVTYHPRLREVTLERKIAVVRQAVAISRMMERMLMEELITNAWEYGGVRVSEKMAMEYMREVGLAR
jgi:hypothetical protein